MGLDISAYSNLVKTEEYRDNSDVFLYKNDFVFEQSKGIEPGYYKVEGKCHSFKAGSYFGYNQWRKLLSEMIGYNVKEIWDMSYALVRDEKISHVLNETPEILKIPFIQLINFSDCEGYIGPVVSNKLYQDFKSNRVKAVNFSKFKKSSRFIELYDDFMEGFRIASDGGAVCFH
jgi:hypothetical protein